MRTPLAAVVVALLSFSCAPELLLQTRPQDAGKQWQPAFVGVYFETNPSPLMTWLIARAVRSGDPFYGEPLRTHPAARDAFLRAGGTGGVTRTLVDQFWNYTTAESMVIWQVWCDDGASETGAAEFKAATSASNNDAVARSEMDRYYLAVKHADGTSDSYPVDAAKFSRCNLERDHFSVHVYLYDRESSFPVARVVAKGVVGLNNALEVALAQSPKAFSVASWSAWNWSALFEHPPTAPAK
jgi:hypothetical protein